MILLFKVMLLLILLGMGFNLRVCLLRIMLLGIIWYLMQNHLGKWHKKMLLLLRYILWGLWIFYKIIILLVVNILGFGMIWKIIIKVISMHMVWNIILILIITISMVSTMLVYSSINFHGLIAHTINQLTHPHIQPN